MSTSSVKCPVCGSVKRFRRRTPTCFVSVCLSCGHEYTAKIDVLVFEDYKRDYYEVTHKQWFDNPQFSLFRKISAGISKLFPSIIESEAVILDVGCGNGDLLFFLSRAFPKANFIGVDTSVKYNGTSNQRVELIDSVFTPDSFDIKFDVIISSQVIEHIYDAKHFVADQVSLLNPSDSSLLVVATINSDSPVYWAARLFKRLGFSLAYDRLYSSHHVNHFSKASLKRLCVSSGLQIVGSTGVNIEMAALDLPSSKFIPKFILKSSTWVMFQFGLLIGRPFLQVCFLKPCKKSMTF